MFKQVSAQETGTKSRPAANYQGKLIHSFKFTFSRITEQLMNILTVERCQTNG